MLAESTQAMPIKVISYTLLLLTFLFSIIDTHLFVYPSLSRSLITGLLIAFMGCVVVGGISIRGRFVFNHLTLLIILWIGYIILYSCVSISETYRVFYLVCSLVFCLVMTMVLQNNTLSASEVENFFLLVGVIQILTVFLQFAGMVGTSRGFLATGLYESPTPTALFLVGCSPFVLERMSIGNKKLHYTIYLCILLLSLFVLKCRTAWIGMLVVSLIYLIPSARSFFKGRTLRVKKMCTVIAFLFAFLMVAYMYNMKKASSDSRLFYMAALT